jgi:hypothetical protein
VQRDGFKSTFFLQAVLVSTILAMFLVLYSKIAASANEKRKDHKLALSFLTFQALDETRIRVGLLWLATVCASDISATEYLRSYKR